MELSIVTHFFNEEMLIGDWIDHHAKMFDYGILINQHSTDSSVEIAESKLPANWKIVTSRLDNFCAVDTDHEVMDYEQTLPGWKIAPTMTEFVFTPNLKEKLAGWIEQNPGIQAFGTRAVSLIDKELDQPLETPIWRNRNHGLLEGHETSPIVRGHRWIHNSLFGQYGAGRHVTSLPHTVPEDLLLLHFVFSPWTQSIPRKLQIQTRIPPSDRAVGHGFQHWVDEAELRRRHDHALTVSRNLFEIPLYSKHYYELLGES
jgi:hypothetical protein